MTEQQSINNSTVNSRPASARLPVTSLADNPFLEASRAVDHTIYDRAARLAAQFGYVFLEASDIRLIQAYFEGRSIVSVGSGKGYVEQQLAEAGFAVRACDIKFEKESSYFKATETIAEDDFGFAARNPDSVLLLSAPDEGRSYAAENLRLYLAAGGDALIYIKFFNPIPPRPFQEQLANFRSLATRDQAAQLSTFYGIRGCAPTRIHLMQKRAFQEPSPVC